MKFINSKNDDFNFKNVIDSERSNLSDTDDNDSEEDELYNKKHIIIKKNNFNTNNDFEFKLEQIKRNYELYYKKMTLIFGGSHTGKTTIVKDILYMLKDKIPMVFIIAPTNISNNAFTGIVPSYMIKYNLERKWLEELWSRQEDAAETYSIVNDLDRLKKLFDIVANTNYKNVEKKILDEATDNLDKIESIDLNIIQKKDKKLKIKELKIDALKKLYKIVIRNNKKILLPKLKIKEDFITVKFLDLNPNVLLLLDDCASQFKSWYKKCNVIKKIFYEGRHKFFTTIITAQDDKEIDSELRKNAMTTIFTSQQSALANFERAANSYSKDIKEKARLCVQKIFEKKKDLPNYKKLVYIRDDIYPFKFMIAKLVDDFKMCCDSCWILSERLEKKKNKINKYNYFFKNL